MKKHWRLLISCLALIVVLVVLVQRSSVRASQEEIQESINSITDTVMRRALQCYVIEGAYPQNLSYLEENYGLTVNHEEYLIVYNAFAENLPPEVHVKYKGRK
ncbi:MAG: hypothetical protein IJ091_08500 [Oscillospiraceae bacterium]|nr:hypothetical protein [Oscillospiraceae bacterium]